MREVWVMAGDKVAAAVVCAVCLPDCLPVCLCVNAVWLFVQDTDVSVSLGRQMAQSITEHTEICFVSG